MLLWGNKKLSVARWPNAIFRSSLVMVEKHALSGDMVDVVCCGHALLHDLLVLWWDLTSNS